MLVALASYGLGGYIAGRMRRRSDASELPEFQDGMHGLVVWGIATFLAGILAAVSLPLLSRTPGVAAATPNATTSVPGESLIAYELDRLFRGSERRTGGDLSYDRAEAARILLTTSSHSGMDPTDRAYLAKLVAADTGTAAPDAERRVDEVAARAKQDIGRARSSAVILAFMAGAAALLGAIAAWAAAVTGGPIPRRTGSHSCAYGIGAEHPKFGVRNPRRQGNRRSPIHSAPTLKGRSIPQLAAALVSTPFLWQVIAPLELPATVLARTQTITNKMRKRQWQRQ